LASRDQCSECTFDYEENGRVTEGSWRAMSNENMIFFTRKIAQKPTVKAKKIREELAAIS